MEIFRILKTSPFSQFNYSSNHLEGSSFNMLSFVVALLFGFLFVNSSSAITVTNTNDSGSGSLRAAIASSSSGSVINFSSSLISSGSATIVLSSNIDIDYPITINGLSNATDTLYISGNGVTQIFRIRPTGSNVTTYLNNLTLIDGNSGTGGAISCSKGNLELNNCVIRNCTASYGGAIYFSESADFYELTLDVNNSSFYNNSASAYGGAIYCEETLSQGTNTARVEVNTSTLNANHAGSRGSAIYCRANVSSANYPGNVYARIYVNQSTIVNNTGPSNGSAIYAYADYSNNSASDGYSYVYLYNSTVVNNAGYGVYAAGETDEYLYTRSSIIAFNGNPFFNGSSPINSQGYNIFSRSSISGSGGTDQLGATAATLALTDLRLNGGTTKTMSPTDGSIAIDAGYTGSTVAAQNIPIVGRRDIGAAEKTTSAGVDTQSSCGSYTWMDGNTYTVSNNSATHIVPNVAGYDSIITLDLTINPTFNETDNATICEGDSYSFGAQTLTTAGLYSETFGSVNGCDSIVDLTLTVNSNSTGADVIISCSDYVWIDGNTYSTSNSTATHTLTNALGCDSVVTLNLTIGDAIVPVADAGTLPDVTDQCSVTNLVAPTATDNCVGSISGTHNASLPITTLGTTIVTWTYDDENGNTSTQTQNVIITGDVTPPVADNGSLSDVTGECSITSLSAPTATDNCAGTISGTHNASLPITAQGTTVVIWTYDDGNGNPSTQTQDVVLNDVTAPIADAVSLPDVIGECSVTSLSAPTATDNCVGSISGTHNASLPITTQGTTTVTWTYDDGNGNTSSQTQDVVINDVTLPVADNGSLPDVTGECSITSFSAPTATDNCVGTISGTHNATLPITTQGTTTVTWTYDDGNGNTSTQTQDVVINDVTLPVASNGSLPDITGECSLTSLSAPTATDNCAGTISGTHNLTLPITTIGTTVATWTYNDGNGNFTTQTQNIVVSACPAAELMISGVYDGPVSGEPKGIELYVISPISDLSIYGVGSANNGGGTDGVEFTFPAVSVGAGTFIYVAANATGFSNFMGFNADYVNAVASINGDDAIELFKNSVVVDVFGDINVDGNGQPWEYTDGWAFRRDCSVPDGNGFVLADWIYSGIDALDGETLNATASTPIPAGSYECIPPCIPTTSTISAIDCDSYTSPSGKVWTISNAYNDTIQNNAGCDSVITVNLTVLNSTSSTDVVTACDSYTWIDGNTYTASNSVATQVLTNSVGCDSVITLNLTLSNSNTGTDIVSACDSYTWIDGNIYTASNSVATHTLTNMAGCDSVVTLNLSIPNSNTGTDVITACDSYTWIDGNTYTASNSVATHTLTNVAGCDSVVTLDLTLSNSNTGTDVVSACDSYTWIDGNTYTATNSVATHTLTNTAGCDSIVTLNLSLSHSNTGTDIVSACDSYTWIDGITYSAPNSVATYTLTNVSGCDSVVTLDFSLLSNTGIDVVTACDSYTWIDGNTYTTSNSVATHTLTNVASCDSVVTLNLTLSNSNTGTDVVSACDTYTWIDGNTYTSANNTATHVLTNAAGCDSVVTLDLSFSNSLAGTDIVTACDSYTWIDGITYTASNSLATQTLTSVAGCDSVVTLNLTLSNSNTGTDVVSACDSYTWIDGITYTASNSTSTQTLTNTAGCDSVVTLNLSLSNSTAGVDVITACDSYTWIDGNTYLASNSVATHTLTNAAGCDSIVTLNLSLSNSNTGTDVITACDSYTWIDGITYSTSNSVATHTLINTAGCDSVVTLNLVINTVDNGVNNVGFSITANATGAQYQWLDCGNNFLPLTGEIAQTFNAPPVNGEYAVEVTENGCADTSICVAIIPVGINEESSSSDILMYPNPSYGLVTVELGNPKAVSISVRNTMGQLVYEQQNINQPTYQMELPRVSGVYFVEIDALGKRTNYRLVIE